MKKLPRLRKINEESVGSEMLNPVLDEFLALEYSWERSKFLSNLSNNEIEALWRDLGQKEINDIEKIKDRLIDGISPKNSKKALSKNTNESILVSHIDKDTDSFKDMDFDDDVNLLNDEISLSQSEIVAKQAKQKLLLEQKPTLDILQSITKKMSKEFVQKTGLKNDDYFIVIISSVVAPEKIVVRIEPNFDATKSAQEAAEDILLKYADEVSKYMFIPYPKVNTDLLRIQGTLKIKK